MENLPSAAVSLIAFPIFEDFPDEVNGDISTSDFFLMLNNEVCERLENMHISLNDVFQMTNTWCNQNHAWGNDPGDGGL